MPFPFSVRKTAAVLALTASLASGCAKFDEGVHSYYSGDWAHAEALLKPYAAKAAKKNPVVSLGAGSESKLEGELRDATYKLFLGWQAFAGSQFALGEVDAGCDSLKYALRPITVKVSGRKPELRDPTAGDYWQAEVKALRSWWLTIPCGTGAPPFPDHQ